MDIDRILKTVFEFLSVVFVSSVAGGIIGGIQASIAVRSYEGFLYGFPLGIIVCSSLSVISYYFALERRISLQQILNVYMTCFIVAVGTSYIMGYFSSIGLYSGYFTPLTFLYVIDDIKKMRVKNDEANNK